MMLQGWVVIAIALGYIGLLFVVASYGDRLRAYARGDRSRLLIYPLCLAIYCTSWTFFGSVGLASKSGFDFLTIYIGPILMIGLCTPLVLRNASAKPPAGVATVLLRQPKGRPAKNVFWLSRRGALTEVARNLYDVLRRADAGGYRQIWVEPLPGDAGGLAAAINDRLQRAAAKR